MTPHAVLFPSSGPIPVFGSLGGITGGIGVDDDDELSVVELELAGVDDDELSVVELELAGVDDEELAEAGAEEDEDATDEEDEEEAGATLLLLVLLLAGGATTVTVGFVTVFESNVTAVCAKALPFSVAPVFKTIAV